MRSTPTSSIIKLTIWLTSTKWKSLRSSQCYEPDLEIQKVVKVLAITLIRFDEHFLRLCGVIRLLYAQTIFLFEVLWFVAVTLTFRFRLNYIFNNIRIPTIYQQKKSSFSEDPWRGNLRTLLYTLELQDHVSSHLLYLIFISARMCAQVLRTVNTLGAIAGTAGAIIFELLATVPLELSLWEAEW